MYYYPINHEEALTPPSPLKKNPKKKMKNEKGE